MIIRDNIKNNLYALFYKSFGKFPDNISPLPESGSNRKYYLLVNSNSKAIGAYNPDKRENAAFISITRHFNKYGLNVPQILGENLNEDIYLLQYLGQTTLYSYLSGLRKDNTFSSELISAYKNVISELPKFQITAGEDMDYSVCYPRQAFDKQSMMWDLNYFKYYFLKLAFIPFDEQKLEDDFNTFTGYLLQADCNYFLYRDFQSRNIMLCDGKPYFIDYQGGRKGALHYDIASLLYDAKANIPQDIREMLLEHYITLISEYKKINRDIFLQFYLAYSLIRIMQAMGAYGYRGYYEKKIHFLQSIPYAVSNLKYILGNYNLPVNMPELTGVLERIAHSDRFSAAVADDGVLKVRINSFSYKKIIPVDETGNGGGFVFDCRAVRNPGALEIYKNSTGKDNDVINFLKQENEMTSFLNNVYALVDQSVAKYLQRGFTDLMVSFGCTGGQHRSVYCAERLAEHLKQKFNVKTILKHTELDNILKT